MLRLLAITFASLIPVLGASPLCYPQEQQTLMAMIAEWQYPDSTVNGATMQDGATVNNSGERTVPSIHCTTVMTTADPIAKVIEYYDTRLKPKADSRAALSKDTSGSDSGRSVMFYDDFHNRPVKIHIISVNTEKTSTTLVISRAESETETYIAWTRYARY